MEDNKQQEQQQGTNESYSDYIETIQKLKETTVSRDDYDRVKAENKKLLDVVVNGNKASLEQTPPPARPDIKKLREELLNTNNNMSNLEYVEKSLQLRDALIESGQPDPFMPIGHNVQPTEEQARAIERTVDVFRDCIDRAQGDSGVFTAELQRRMRDTTIRRH